MADATTAVTGGALFNAATGPNLTAAASNYVTPPQLGTPSTPSSGSFTQGAPLPNITTTQQQATAAPSWYMDYLSNLANTSTQAGQNAQYIGAQPLQQQAFAQTAANQGNYQPLLNAATGQVNQVGGMSAYGAGADALNESIGMSGANAAQGGINAAMQIAPSNIQQYMNPYTRNVVDEMTRLGQQNIRQSLSPQTTAGIVGAGQFGSTRGAQALGQNITNALQDLGGRQSTALQAGYTQALGASQADMARQLQAGVASGQLTAADAQRIMQAGQAQGQLTSADMDARLKSAQQYGALAGQQQSMGLADINALSTMGSQQQQIAQNQQLFPLQVAAQQAALMKGYTIPTSVASTYTGPIPGAYQQSPLAQIGQIGSGVLGLFQPPTGGGSTPFQNLISGIGNIFNTSGGGGIDYSGIDFSGYDPSNQDPYQ